MPSNETFDEMIYCVTDAYAQRHPEEQDGHYTQGALDGARAMAERAAEIARAHTCNQCGFAIADEILAFAGVKP